MRISPQNFSYHVDDVKHAWPIQDKKMSDYSWIVQNSKHGVVCPSSYKDQDKKDLQWSLDISFAPLYCHLPLSSKNSETLNHCRWYRFVIVLTKSFAISFIINGLIHGRWYRMPVISNALLQLYSEKHFHLNGLSYLVSCFQATDHEISFRDSERLNLYIININKYIDAVFIPFQCHSGNTTWPGKFRKP